MRKLHSLGTVLAVAGIATGAAFPVLMVATWTGAASIAEYMGAGPYLLAAMFAGQGLIALGCYLQSLPETRAMRA